MTKPTGFGYAIAFGCLGSGSRESEGGSKEGRLPGARGLWSPIGGWKAPLLHPTAGCVNSEMHPFRIRRIGAVTPSVENAG